MPPDPLFMHGMSDTHMAFRHCYTLYKNIISQKGPFSKNAPPPPPPHGKILKKGPDALLYLRMIQHVLSHILSHEFYTCTQARKYRYK
jgi:hypothetical protein